VLRRLSASRCRLPDLIASHAPGRYRRLYSHRRSFRPDRELSSETPTLGRVLQDIARLQRYDSSNAFCDFGYCSQYRFVPQDDMRTSPSLYSTRCKHSACRDTACLERALYRQIELPTVRYRRCSPQSAAEVAAEQCRSEWPPSRALRKSTDRPYFERSQSDAQIITMSAFRRMGKRHDRPLLGRSWTVRYARSVCWSLAGRSRRRSSTRRLRLRARPKNVDLFTTQLHSCAHGSEPARPWLQQRTPHGSARLNAAAR